MVQNIFEIYFQLEHERCAGEERSAFKEVQNN